jgi:hypothetical protein
MQRMIRNVMLRIYFILLKQKMGNEQVIPAGEEVIIFCG